MAQRAFTLVIVTFYLIFAILIFSLFRFKNGFAILTLKLQRLFCVSQIAISNYLHFQCTLNPFFLYSSTAFLRLISSSYFSFSIITTLPFSIPYMLQFASFLAVPRIAFLPACGSFHRFGFPY